jgi:hypothetical protein
MVRILKFLGLPEDFTNLISNIYHETTTKLVTSHNHTPPVEVRRDIHKGHLQSLLLIDRMIATLIRWLYASNKNCNITTCDLQLERKWYADDGTLVTNSVEDTITLLDIVQ